MHYVHSEHLSSYILHCEVYFIFPISLLDVFLLATKLGLLKISS